MVSSSHKDHIVIEAGGVADPAKIAQYDQMYQLPLDGILVVIGRVWCGIDGMREVLQVSRCASLKP